MYDSFDLGHLDNVLGLLRAEIKNAGTQREALGTAIERYELVATLLESIKGGTLSQTDHRLIHYATDLARAIIDPTYGLDKDAITPTPDPGITTDPRQEMASAVARVTRRGQRFTLRGITRVDPSLKEYGRALLDVLDSAGRKAFSRTYTLADGFEHLQDVPNKGYELPEPSRIAIVPETETALGDGLEEAFDQQPTSPDTSPPTVTPTVTPPPQETQASYEWKRPLDDIEDPFLRALAGAIGPDTDGFFTEGLKGEELGTDGRSVYRRVAGFVRIRGKEGNARMLELTPEVRSYLMDEIDDLPDKTAHRTSRSKDATGKQGGTRRGSYRESPQVDDGLMRALYEAFPDGYTIGEAVGSISQLSGCSPQGLSMRFRKIGIPVTGERDTGVGSVKVYGFDPDFLKRIGTEDQGSHPTPVPSGDTSVPRKVPIPVPIETEIDMKILPSLLTDVVDILTEKDGITLSPDAILDKLKGYDLDEPALATILDKVSNDPSIWIDVVGDGCRLEYIGDQHGHPYYFINLDPEPDNDTAQLVAMEAVEAIGNRSVTEGSLVSALQKRGIELDDDTIRRTLRYITDNPDKVGVVLMTDGESYYTAIRQQDPAPVMLSTKETLGNYVADAFSDRPDGLVRTVGGIPDGMLRRTGKPGSLSYLVKAIRENGIEITPENVGDVSYVLGIALVTESDGNVSLDVYRGMVDGRIRRTSIVNFNGGIHATCGLVPADDTSLTLPIRRAGNIISFKDMSALNALEDLRQELFGYKPYAAALPKEGWSMLFEGAAPDDIVTAATHLSVDGSPENIEMNAIHMGLKPGTDVRETLTRLENRVQRRGGRFSGWRDNDGSAHKIFEMTPVRVKVSAEDAFVEELGSMYSSFRKNDRPSGIVMSLYRSNFWNHGSDVVRVFGVSGQEAVQVMSTTVGENDRNEHKHVLSSTVTITKPLPAKIHIPSAAARISVDDLALLMKKLS